MKTLLFVLLTSFAAFGQYLEKYYPLINEAELAIVDSNYQQALTLYRTAFSHVDTPHGADYMNAAKCAFLIFDETAGTFYLKKLAGYGYSPDYLKTDVQNALFRDVLSKNTALVELLEVRATNFFTKQNNVLEANKPLVQCLQKLKQKAELELQHENQAEIELLNRELANFLQAKWQMGFDFSNQVERYVLLSLLQDKRILFSEKKLEQILIKAVDDGYLNPQEVGNILAVRKYDFLLRSERLLTKISVNPFVCDNKETIGPLVDKWLTDKELIASKTGQKINKVRKRFGQESLADELKKRVHSMICNDECNFDLRCPRQHTQYPTNCEETKALLQGMAVFESE